MATEAESAPSPQPDAAADPSWSLATGLGVVIFWFSLVLVIPLTSVSLAMLLHRFDPADWQRIMDETYKDPWTAVADAMCTLFVWIVTFGVLEAWFRRFSRDAVRRSLALVRPNSGWSVVPMAAILGAVLGVVAVEVQSLIQTPDSASPFDVFTSSTIGRIALVFVGVLLAPPAEELLFRGFLMAPMERMGRAKYGPRRGLLFAVLLNAALFTIAHSLQYDFSELVELLCVGIVLSTLRVWSGSLWPAIVAHLSYNACQLVLAFAFGGSP